ncbi:MAG: glycosyltransferase family 4 protein [Chthoniobacterales bacterium]
MKIAIIAPCPVPYTIGGAEKMWWGLQRQINTQTSHQCELIKLPTREHSFWELIESYEAFAKLDLSGFDLVISGKYPAWMVSHPRHICYMQHRLRGLYDCYHYFNLPERYETAHPELVSIQRLLERAPSRESLDEVFSRLKGLRYRHDLPADAFEFPGPFIKQVLEYLDGVGLATDAIESYFAISKTVRDRAYFPAAAAVQALYPPSNLEEFRCGNFDYIFTASRLDSAKRIHLLVDAMKLVKSDVELRIAGEGPDRARLEAAANGDARITFLGFRSDADLIDDYANALAVAFLPQDEDYGLITVEAMMSGKPVITTPDAGGPTEFVSHERTGMCVDPTPAQLAATFDRLAGDRKAAERMGKAARERVAPITWKNTADALLNGRSTGRPRTRVGKPARRKLTVATTFGVTPVRGGGQARIFHLYKNLFPEFETDLITLGGFNEPPFINEIAPGVREIRIPKSAEHTEAENNISAQVEWFTLTDAVFPSLAHLTPQYAEALARSARNADAVVASHPYPLTAIEGVSDKPLWYEAQDVEYMLKRDVIPKTARGLQIVEEVREIEQRCCSKASLIMTCSEADRDHLAKLYGLDPASMHIVPNGADTSRTTFVPRAHARELKRQLGLSEEFLALFIGSWHQPNLDAIEVILSVAEQHSDVQFLIVGSSCGAFTDRPHPANVGFFGVVDDNTISLVIGAADLALNPMAGGSGTNLKMLDYAAAGVPILSSAVGLRGLDFRPGTDVFVSPLEEFAAGISAVRQTSATALQAMTLRARQRAEIQFDWRNISRRFLAGL